MIILAIAAGIILAVLILKNLDTILTAFKWVVLSVVGLVAVGCLFYWAENAGIDLISVSGILFVTIGFASIAYCELTD